MDQLKFNLLVELGNLCIKLGKFKDAKAYFEKALEENSENELPYVGLAKIELKNKNVDKAEQFLEKLDGSNKKFILSEIKFLKKDFEESYKLLIDALKEDPENLEGITLLGKLSFKLNKYDDFERFLKIFHSKNPSDTNIIYALAGCLYCEDKLDEAKKYLEKLLTIDKENIKAKELLEIINKKIEALKEVGNG